MQVEIISHDHLTMNAYLEILPRIGEHFNGSNKNGDEISGTVRHIEHSYNGSKGNHSITVYLAP